MDSKKIVIALIVIGVVAGVWYSLKSDAGTSDVTKDLNVAGNLGANEVEQNQTGFDTFASLMARGGSAKCDFKSTSPDGEVSSGTFYHDNDRFRVDGDYQADGETVSTHMINDGKTTYTWGMTADGMMAMKFDNAEMESSANVAAQTSASAEQNQIDVNERVEYDCGRWNVDNSMLVPPSDVDFMDMEAMMKEAMQGMPEGFEMPEGFMMGQ